MKLHEIKLLPDAIVEKRYSIDDFTDGESFGFSEGGTHLRKCTGKKDDRLVLFALYDKSNTTFLAGLVGYFFNFNNLEYFKVQDIFVPQEHRNKGYATALYVSLIKKYHIKMMSDVEQTLQGKALWDRLSNIVNVNVVDATTKQILPRDKVSDEDIYVNYPDRYILIAEQQQNTIYQFGIPLVGDGIVSDHLIYTRPEAIGKYL